MKNLYLFSFLLLSLQDGNSFIVYSRVEGADITVECSNPSYATRKVFCKESCEANVLLETTKSSEQRGRYSIKLNQTVLSVTITQLNKSDSGEYRCGSTYKTNLLKFEVIVIDAQLDQNSKAAKQKPFHKKNGSSVTVKCGFTFTGKKRFFSKKQGDEDKVLIRTFDDSAQKDRYSIRFINGVSGGGFIFVMINQLKESDSGRYLCGIDNSFHEFQIFVSSVSSTPGITESVTTSGSVTNSSATPGITYQSGKQKTELQPEDGSDFTMLYVALGLVAIVLLLSLAVVIYCRRGSSKTKESSGEREYASITETKQVYEFIRHQDRQSRAPAVEVSSALSGARFIKTDESCFVNAAGPEHKDEDESHTLTYTEVDFSNRTQRGADQPPPDRGSDVVYSVLRLQDASYSTDDTPLYSSVA